jgi:transposase
MICAQTRMPGMSVSQVARRYDVNANLVFKWLRDPRFAPGEDFVADARFLPVEIVCEQERPPQAPIIDNRIEIELAGGHRIRISGSYDPEMLARLIRSLSA